MSGHSHRCRVMMMNMMMLMLVVVNGFVVVTDNPAPWWLGRSPPSYSSLSMTASSSAPPRVPFPPLSDHLVSGGNSKNKAGTSTGRSSLGVPQRRVFETWTWQNDRRSYRINYRVEGKRSASSVSSSAKRDERPILLVHGFGANLLHFRHQYDDLVAAGYTVYGLDLLGFGASEKPSQKNASFSIELFARQMMDFMHAMDPSAPWIVAGNSMGGLCNLVVAAAASSPSSSLPISKNKVDIGAVVLFNCAGGMTGFRYQDLPIWAHPIMGHVQYFVMGKWHGRFMFNTIAQRAVIAAALTQTGIYKNITRVDNELLDLLLAPAADEGAAQVFLSVFAGPPGPTREAVLPNVRVPVLAFWGADDPFTPLDDAVKALPRWHGTKDFTLHVLPNTGHCLHDERPEVVNPAMIQFLKDRGL
jgi:pimeloyl-ACP methyl ester carboxylesterase